MSLVAAGSPQEAELMDAGDDLVALAECPLRLLGRFRRGKGGARGAPPSFRHAIGHQVFVVTPTEWSAVLSADRSRELERSLRFGSPVLSPERSRDRDRSAVVSRLSPEFVFPVLPVVVPSPSPSSSSVRSTTPSSSSRRTASPSVPAAARPGTARPTNRASSTIIVLPIPLPPLLGFEEKPSHGD